MSGARLDPGIADRDRPIVFEGADPGTRATACRARFLEIWRSGAPSPRGAPDQWRRLFSCRSSRTLMPYSSRRRTPSGRARLPKRLGGKRTRVHRCPSDLGRARRAPPSGQNRPPGLPPSRRPAPTPTRPDRSARFPPFRFVALRGRVRRTRCPPYDSRRMPARR